MRLPQATIDSIFERAKELFARLTETSAVRLSTVRRDPVLARLHDAAEGGNEFARLSLLRLSKPHQSLLPGRKGKEKESAWDAGVSLSSLRKRLPNAPVWPDDVDELDELKLPDFDPTHPGPLADAEDWREYNEALEEHGRAVADYERRLRELHERLAVRP